jgi:hypothetical protein
MTKKLVLIHGRAQQNKDAAALKGEWISAWKKGLAANGLALPIPETDIRFPYYGDTLDQLVAGKSPADAAKVIIKGPKSDAEREFVLAVMEEVRKKAGISKKEVVAEMAADVEEKGPLNWGWVQAVLKVIDRKVPYGSSTSIALFTKDVFQYLTKSGIRDTIDNGVLAAIQPGEETVVVSHSLGTVVAYSILRREGEARGWKIPLFVTLGSPLGITKIRQSLSPTTFPKCAGAWFNAFDERDVVALYPLEKPYFLVTPKITNKTDVSNHTENRHGIAGYLDDPAVAKTIHDAVL